jgi:hypothetical protein
MKKKIRIFRSLDLVAKYHKTMAKYVVTIHNNGELFFFFLLGATAQRGPGPPHF